MATTFHIKEDTHLSLKQLALDIGEKLQDTGDAALIIGIAEMRKRLKAQTKRKKHIE